MASRFMEFLTPNALRARVHATQNPPRIPLVGHIAAPGYGEALSGIKRPGSHRAKHVNTQPQFKIGVHAVSFVRYNHPMMGERHV